MKNLILCFMLIASLTFSQVEKAKLQLPALFSDNMVLQQKTDASVWGTAEANKTVTTKGSWGKSVTAKVSEDGKWFAKIKTPKAGGPYQLTIKCAEESITYKNILIGEVWLCSGQSNMEMPLLGWPPRDTITNSAKEIASAKYPNLRLFTVARNVAASPLNDCKGSWSECSPKAASTFSATAFFFGKKLLSELKIPIGLIHSSWGGTPVEAWTSGKVLSTTDQYEDILGKFANGQQEYNNLLSWIEKLPQIDLSKNKDENIWRDVELNDKDCSLINYDDSKWLDAQLPCGWDKINLNNFDGVIWFRKQVEVPETWLNKDLLLTLGPIDDMDAAFVNGIKVGGFEKPGYWQMERVYVVPAEFVKDKKVTIAVRVIDNQGGGGIYGLAEKLRLHLKGTTESISIAGSWKYLPVAEYKNAKFYLFSEKNLEFLNRPNLSVEVSAYQPTTLYNAMIAPLIPFNLRGAIWYQGESNTGESHLYKNLFSLMINNWREDFQNQFSFYFTQIAPYRYDAGTNSQLLREAQLQTLDIPRTGMAVTMDISDIENIHPANKKDVGERLARWALAKDYGKRLAFSGPIYKSFKIENDKMILSFDYADGLKIKTRAGENNFLIAGEDGVFKKADVEIDGKELIVSSPGIINPKAVRYCWSDIAEGTLYNSSGLPSPSFRTDDWK